MTVGIASLAGVPLTVGFFGKFLIFNVAIQHAMYSGYWFLVAFAILGATAGFYYYFKIIKAMYFDKSDNDVEGSISVNPLSKVLILSLVALVIISGVFPKLLMSFL